MIAVAPVRRFLTLVIVAACIAAGPRALAAWQGAVPHATIVRSLDDRQIGYVRSGDSALVIAAFELDRDSMFAALLRGDASRPVFAASITVWDSIPAADPRTHLAEWVLAPRWTTALIAPWDSLVIGAELVAAGDMSATGDIQRRGMRAHTRLWIAPPLHLTDARVRLSDIFFIEAGGEGPLPTALEGPNGALPKILGTTNLARSAPVAIFWEVYGLRPGENASIALEVLQVERERNEAARIADVLGVGRGESEILMRWQEQASAGTDPERLALGWARTRALDVGALANGIYEAVLTYSVRGEKPAQVRRLFRVGDAQP